MRFMKSILCTLLVITSFGGLCQGIVSSVSVSHYAHPELYMKAGVVCFVTDKQGNPARDGSYLFINNRSSSAFYFNSSGVNKEWKKLQPNQKILISVQKEGQGTVVPLRVKYTKLSEGNSGKRISDLKMLNALSDRISYTKPSGGTTSKPKPGSSDIRKDAIAVKPQQVKKPAIPNPGTSIKTAKVLGDKSKNTIKNPPLNVAVRYRCMNTSAPAYYTFYYLKVNQTVFYSDVFPVAAYSNESEGEELLNQAWNCFLDELRAKYEDEGVQRFLNDQDNDLRLGLMHLRNPFIPSAKILQTYPYTATATSAQLELKRWMEYENSTYPGLSFVKIDFV